MKKKVPPKKLIKLLDDLVSVYVRKRDGACVTCGTTMGLTCSHLIRRGKMSVRFNLKNCSTQCYKENFRHNYFPELYTEWFIRTNGKDEYLKLVEESKRLKKYTREELEALIDVMRGLIANI